MTSEIFHLYLIKPTRYDVDGYPIQWFRSSMPANTLACMHSLAQDAKSRQVLGPDVEIRVTALDETCQRVVPEKIARQIRRKGGRALIGFVGVQTNQFPRTIDLARRFRQQNLPVCIGGFHVSGCLSMLPETPPELIEAQELGISLFAGEAEDCRFDRVIRDAYAGSLAPVYDYLNDMTDLTQAPVPHLPRDITRRNFLKMTSFDLGRGCPYNCSFCCIINVQGRKSRFRTADSLEKIIRHNAAMGFEDYFVTDDNLARNKNWKLFFNRLIKLRRKEGLSVSLIIQVDTLCHRIPQFIDKAVAAGVVNVFIGMENINPDNLAAVNKKQNKITEYRKMLLAWKKHPVVIYAGYIIGFPNDTPESVLRDVEVIKRELPIDILNATILTPIPGSADHRDRLAAGVWMDPDLNKYNLANRVTHHPKMTDEEFDRLYQDVFRSYFTFDHMVTILKRMRALNSQKRLNTILPLSMYGSEFVRDCNNGYEYGFFRMKFRKERQSGMPIENPIPFYLKYAGELFGTTLRFYWMFLRLNRMYHKIGRDPERLKYRDIAITSPSDDEFETLNLFKQTRGGQGAVNKHKTQAAIKAEVAEQPARAAE